MPLRGLSVLGHLVDPLLQARGCIQLFRLVSIAIVFWYERLTFTLASLQCSSTASTSTWIPFGSNTRSSSSTPQSQTSFRVTILSDPQLIDSHTYTWVDQLITPLSSFIQHLLRWASDTYAQKSYSAVIRQSGSVQSDAVIWLGDLLDGGRRPLLSSEDVFDFEKQARRFKGLFEEKLPSIYLPGNHDVRIPLTHNPTFDQEWKDSRARWLEEWGIWEDDRGRATWSRKGGREHVVLHPPGGPTEVNVEGNNWKQIINARFPLYLNQTSSNPTHEIIMVDSLELAGMMPAAVAPNLHFEWQKEAKERFAETYNFVESFSKSSDQNTQRVLISHIPLSRPANSNCNLRQANHGVTRESSGAIDQGVDQYATYQNLLSTPVTEWLLETIQPQLIFSGDNHDHCEVQHGYGLQETATELTLKAFSMTEGVRLPGYARLSLQLDESSGQSSMSYVPCLLPDQISIWTQSYPVCLILIFACLMLDRRWRLGAKLDQQARIWRIHWQDWIGSHVEDDDDEQDKDWQMVEEGGGHTSDEYHNLSVGGYEEDDEQLGSPASPLRGSTLNKNTLQSPGAKRIRYGRTSLALQPLASSSLSSTASPSKRSKGSSVITLPRIVGSAASPISTSFPSSSSNHNHSSSFQSRAWRELRRAAKANEKVVLQDGPLREMTKILLWPLVVWIWLQLF